MPYGGLMGAPGTIAVVGSGISGLSAAWLLSRRYDVTLFEAENRPGGHSNTVEALIPGGPAIPVDTGFIVYNTACYPNLIALFESLGVPTASTDMSFAVSLGGGSYEYSGSSLATLFGQPSNVLRPSHWRMLADTLRFFRETRVLDIDRLDPDLTLGVFLARAGYSEAFTARHILPMAAAIWSTPSRDVLDFPVAAFIRFFSNHGLLQVANRPEWRTVAGGSREYVKRILADFRGRIALGEPVRRISRSASGATLATASGEHRFDACVIATHADEALSLLADPSREEQTLLGAFRYALNRAVLHTDATVMPRRKRLWSSWNYIGDGKGRDATLAVTYWMNKLQPLGPAAPELFVTLNPPHEIGGEHALKSFDYAHPMFDAAAMRAARDLWRLQGLRKTWFCGSYFGYGFHEDGIQSGLAAAESIGGVRRPWQVEGESSRIHLGPAAGRRPLQLEAAE
ncbi:MAG: FAD-dependent oxidoreductase [Proteobacteria bacterium]|nr:FAD-dependent oxidoreductase [Pseudomonadota bacterium]